MAGGGGRLEGVGSFHNLAPFSQGRFFNEIFPHFSAMRLTSRLFVRKTQTSF